VTLYKEVEEPTLKLRRPAEKNLTQEENALVALRSGGGDSEKSLPGIGKRKIREEDNNE
jgi:hypothetical protein